MKSALRILLLTLFVSGNAVASDFSIDFVLSGLDLPVKNAESGDDYVSMVFLEADLTFHARSIALNGFMRDTAGYVWASYGTCKLRLDAILYCAFTVENISVYFTLTPPAYSGEVVSVNNVGEVFDTGIATIVNIQ